MDRKTLQPHCNCGKKYLFFSITVVRFPSTKLNRVFVQWKERKVPAASFGKYIKVYVEDTHAWVCTSICTHTFCPISLALCLWAFKSLFFPPRYHLGFLQRQCPMGTRNKDKLSLMWSNFLPLQNKWARYREKRRQRERKAKHCLLI